MIFRIANQRLTMLEREARKEHPVEACALLFGKLNEEEAVVERAVITTNVLGSATRFKIDSREFYDAFTKANKDGLEFVGFFHSHQAPAEPSSVDLQFMRLWGDAVWLIFSSVERRFAAFHLRNGEVRTLSLRTEEKT